MNKSYKAWLIRLKTEKEYCQYLFEYATTRLMCHKYGYYIMNQPLVDDIAYDGEEKSWYLMGRGLKLLKKDETSPCIGFDYNHKFAKLGIELYNKLPKRR